MRQAAAVLGLAMLAGCTLTVTGPPPLPTTSTRTAADPAAAPPLLPGRRTAPAEIRLAKLGSGPIAAAHTVIVAQQVPEPGSEPQPVVIGLGAGTSTPVRLPAVERLLRTGDGVALSPDGRQAALVHLERQAMRGLEAHVVTLATGEDRRLDQPSDPQCPPVTVDWGPVERLVAVQDACGGLHLASPDTGRISRLWSPAPGSGTAAESRVFWSPDGQRLASTLTRPDAATEEEYVTVVVGRDGKAQRTLDLLALSQAAWGRDGRALRGRLPQSGTEYVQVDPATGASSAVGEAGQVLDQLTVVGTNGAHVLGVARGTDPQREGGVDVWTANGSLLPDQRWTRVVGATAVTSVETAGSPAVDPGD